MSHHIVSRKSGDITVIMIYSAAILVLFAFAGANAEDMKSKLMPIYVNHALHCMKELNVPITTCKEMIQDGNDNTQAKYDSCKCIPACVGKRVKAMTEDGEADEARMTEMVSEFQNPEWDAEWKRILPICKPTVEGKKHCALGEGFIACSYKESEIFRDVLKKVVEKMN